MKVDRIILSSNNNKLYYDFWNPLSKVYLEKFNIKPTLIWVGTEEEKNDCGISDKYGEIIIAEPNYDYHVNSQCTISSYWATQFFPDDICFICGIDEVALSGMFIKDMIKEYGNDDYVMLIANAYAGQHWSRDNSVSPSGYHIAKGSTFSDIYNFKKSFRDTIEMIFSSGILHKYLDIHIGGYPSENPNWGLDETYICHKLRNYNGGNKIISLDNFNLMWETRIECYRVLEPEYDMNKLINGGYSHSHLCRPFSEHSEYILNMFNNIPVSN